MTTPHAILLGSVLAGALIGSGVYLGLQRTPAPAPVAAGHLAAPAAADSAPAGVATAPPSSALRVTVARQVATVLETHRTALARACLPVGRPGRADFVWNVTFDASGRQLARGINEKRGTVAMGLGGCVGERTPAFAVPPPGAIVEVEVPFSLP